MSDPYFRPIRRDDDAEVAALIREVMTEFGCSGSGFAMLDPEVAAMSEAYRAEGAAFYVVLTGQGERAEIMGTGGFAPLVGVAPEDRVVELRKMYFRRELRGRGVGGKLLTYLLREMRGAKHRSCYLETTSWMPAAVALYCRHGFNEISNPLGATGHSGCNRYFVRDL